MSCHSFLLMKMQLSIDFHTTSAQLANNFVITSERLYTKLRLTHASRFMIAETQPDYPPAKYIDIILTNGYNEHNTVRMGILGIPADN